MYGAPCHGDAARYFTQHVGVSSLADEVGHTIRVGSSPRRSAAQEWIGDVENTLLAIDEARASHRVMFAALESPMPAARAQPPERAAPKGRGLRLRADRGPTPDRPRIDSRIDSPEFHPERPLHRVPSSHSLPGTARVISVGEGLSWHKF